MKIRCAGLNRSDSGWIVSDVNRKEVYIFGKVWDGIALGLGGGK